MFDIHLSQRAVYTLSTLLALIFLVLCLAAQNYAEMLADRAFRTAGVSCLHNEFEATRCAAYRIHKDAGFRETGTENGNVQLLLTREEYLR